MTPVIANIPSTKASNIDRLCVTSKKRRLSARSATLPPMSAKRKKDDACARDTIPRANAEPCVICNTNRLCATICIHVPIDDTIRLIHKRRKLRYCKARKVCNLPAVDRSGFCSGSVLVMENIALLQWVIDDISVIIAQIQFPCQRRSVSDSHTLTKEKIYAKLLQRRFSIDLFFCEPGYLLSGYVVL